jgi:hypothetical protein
MSMADQRKSTPKPRSGRPPKFAEPRRPVTVTLPERTLRQLTSIHPDRAKAIAKAVDVVVGEREAVRGVEQLEVARGQKLLVVGPNGYLEKIPGLQMVEISHGRFLLVLQSGMPVDSLEVAITDLIEEVPEEQEQDLRVLKSLLEIVRSLRRERRIAKAEILFVQKSLGLGPAS